MRKAKTIHPRKNLLLNLPMKIVRQKASPQSQHIRGTRLFAHPCHPGTMVTMMYRLRKVKTIHPRKNLLLNLPMKIVRQKASPQSQHIRGTRLFAHPCHPGTMVTMMYRLRKAKTIHPRKNLLLNLPMKIVRQIASPQSQHISGTRLFAHPCYPGTMATMMYKL